MIESILYRTAIYCKLSLDGGTIIKVNKYIHIDASTKSLLHLAWYEIKHYPIGTIIAGVIGGLQ